MQDASCGCSANARYLQIIYLSVSSLTTSLSCGKRSLNHAAKISSFGSLAALPMLTLAASKGVDACFVHSVYFAVVSALCSKSTFTISKSPLHAAKYRGEHVSVQFADTF